MFWDDLWKREKEFSGSGKSEFRHGSSFVAVSAIAEQFYCEYKVENEFAFGEISTEAKDTGTELHDELIPQVAITKEEFVNLVERKEPSYAVLRVWGNVDGLRIIGVPDHIVWSEGKPLWLVELKTTRGDPTSLWPDQVNQIRIYALLLEVMGFDCSRLRLALVRVRTDGLSDEEKRLWVEKVSGPLQSGKTGEFESRYKGSMKVHILTHDKSLAESIVQEKRDYWLGKRQATSSTSMGKCRACEYRSVCPKSLFKEPE